MSGDPLFAGGFDWVVIAFVVAKALIGFTIVMVGVIFMIWFERKVVADMQNRIGPNRAGKWGLAQTLADGIKLIFKEDLKPERADKVVFRLAPYLSVVPAFLTFTIVPIGGVFSGGNDGAIEIFGRRTWMQVADPPIGVLFLLAMSSIAVYGIMLAGWASGSKYPLLGSVRASAQMVSYEAALGLSVVAVVLISGSLSTHDIVAAQAGSIANWNLIATAGIPFAIFCVAATAELNRPPFDLVEAEQELVGGFHTEYSSMRFGMFYLAEFMNTITMSAIIVTLFLGGPAGPVLFGPDIIWGTLWFTVKLLVFLFTFVWLRATLPRYRYDQLMDLGWKRLIPLALGWLLVIGTISVGRDAGWSRVLTLGGAFAVGVVAWAGLAGAMRTSRLRGAEDHYGEMTTTSEVV
ncbi:MAG TPA: NADH-quinone oxidoreductase subunit NuoH [Acidimicrobiales bacterium]|jgi:NADH-quinone oxidoreductase subunit H|nr:NADH-quinone oxidoreductase subunit NuoH [Acidimicrobiales bacterium]